MKNQSVSTKLWMGSGLFLCLSMLSLTGCITEPVGDTQIDPQSVEVGKAKNVDVRLKVGVGQLRLSGGAKKLLEGEFVYNVARWKPEIKYEVAGDYGKLVVRQPEGHGAPAGGKVKNDWNLSLNDQVPMDLDIELGVGKSELELGSLNLNKLNIRTGVGESTIDLCGDLRKDFQSEIEGGIGQVTLRLPAHVGVRIEAEKGIGSIQARDFKKDNNTYTNEALGKSKVTLHVRIKAGIGEIRLELI
jgi:hypothetical protein